MDHARFNIERWKLVGLHPQNARMFDIAWKDENVVMVTNERDEQELFIDMWGDGSEEHFNKMLKRTMAVQRVLNHG